MAARLGYQNVLRLPEGYFGWIEILTGKEKPVEAKKAGEGDEFPSCRLLVLNESDRKYLKIDGMKNDFALEETGFRYFYIVIYNENCLACLAELKNYKMLYKKITDHPYLAEQIIIFGIGAGSKKRGVIAFKKENSVPYPLFGDENRDIFLCLGNPELPTSYLVNIEPGGRRQILSVQHGHIENIDILFQKIVSYVKISEKTKK